MQNTPLPVGARDDSDGYTDRIELEDDATDQELLIEGVSNLASRIINGFKHVPENGKISFAWFKKGKIGAHSHISLSAKVETIDHTGAIVAKKPKEE